MLKARRTLISQCARACSSSLNTTCLWRGNTRAIRPQWRTSTRAFSHSFTHRQFPSHTGAHNISDTTAVKQEESNRRDEEYHRRAKPVRVWLWTLSGLVFGIVAVGGLTRLEEGGLSMVTWSPLGSLPPITQREWEEEFERYKLYPEYLKKNMGMSLDEFKYIYWYEYLHRMLGRVIGVTYAIPAAYFAYKGLIGFKSNPNRVISAGSVLLIGGLIGFQGLLGWYMVKSGLDSEHELMKKYNNVPRVSQYRLASHLLTAFTIYGLSVWSLLDVMYPKSFSNPHVADPSLFQKLKSLSKASPLLTALVFITAASGAFVAGMDAGLVYNEFPLMGGRLIPSDIGALAPWWKNCFENATTVQFQHRMLATLTSIAIGSLYYWTRYCKTVPFKSLPPQVRFGVQAFMVVLAFQYSLGIATLLTYVPTSLASAHQMGSLSLFTVAIYFMHAVRRVR